MGKINTTEDDINLAKIYFTLLVEVAHRGESIEYGELVSRAKERYEGYDSVDGAIATSAGRRLEALRDHTNTLGLADITSLCVTKGSDTAGDAYHLDSEAHRKFVYKTVWLDHYCKVQSLLDLTKVKLELGSLDKC